MSELQDVREHVAELIVRVERISGRQCQFGAPGGVAAWMESIGKREDAQRYRRLIERRKALEAAAEAGRNG